MAREIEIYYKKLANVITEANYHDLPFVSWTAMKARGEIHSDVQRRTSGTDGVVPSLRAEGGGCFSASSQAQRTNPPSFVFSFYSDPQWVECFPILRRVISHTRCTSSNANLIQKLPHRHTQK